MSGRIPSIFIVFCLIPLLLSACGNDSGNPDEGGNGNDSPQVDEVRSEKQRISAPQLAQGELERQVSGNSAFAFELYQQIRGEDGNLFYSPHSISLALAMLFAGARGDTEQQMADSLHFELTQDRLHPVFNMLDLDLASRGQGSKAADGGVFRLNIVNAIWGQRDYPFFPTFLDELALNYGAGLRVLDFIDMPEDSRLAINQWVEQQTEQRIKDLLPKGSINSLTRLVLTNAIYFNAAWAEPFEESATTNGTFNTLDGQQVNVPMMSGAMSTTFMEGEGYKAATLPYDGHELSMLLIVPDAGKFNDFETNLTRTTIDDILQGMRGVALDLTLPSFEFEAELGLKQTLELMGMTDAFAPGVADLSGIDGSQELFVTDVLHKAFIKVNEAGTEAAAATAVIAGTTSIPEPASLTVDRPFIFLIRDHASGAILFVGRVVDPS